MAAGLGKRKVVVVDDDPFVLAALVDLIDRQDDFTVIGTARDAEAGIATVARLRPDIALLDVVMPCGGGGRAARELSERCPEIKLVALSASQDADTVRHMLDAGVHRYAIKTAPSGELLDVLRALGTEPERSTGRFTPEENGREADRTERVSVLVAEEDPAVLALLADAIDADPKLELVGLAQSPAHAASLAACHQPDVALVDVLIPSGGGSRAAVDIRAASPDTAVVGLAGRADREPVLEMLRSGARSYVVDDTEVSDLLSAVHRAAAGGAFLTGVAAHHVVDELVLRLDRTGAPSDDVRNERVARAVAGDNMATLLQPICDLRDRAVIGYEALTRFGGEPHRGTEVWFAEAATMGRQLDLERTAVQHAMARLDELPHQAFLSVNASPALAASGELPELLGDRGAERVVVEMTEHAPVEDYDELSSALAHLRERGARFAVDDAGAGFSSLRHILRLSPDFIKLDVSLCRGVGTDQARRAMARALAGFAAETSSTVIAEGIEYPADLSALLELDVPYGQGYELGRPAARLH